MEILPAGKRQLSAVERNTTQRRTLVLPQRSRIFSLIFIEASVMAVLNLRSSEMALPEVDSSIMEIKQGRFEKQGE